MAGFRFKSGLSFKGLDAETVGQELEQIRRQNGGIIKADFVLDAAREETSPIHGAFTWDDGVAAEKQRLAEARQLIVNIRVFTPAVAKAAPVYLNVTEKDHGRGYRLATEVLSDAVMRERVLMQAVQAIESLQRRYGAIQELADALEILKKATA